MIGVSADSVGRRLLAEVVAYPGEVGELARRVTGAEDPSGAFERMLTGLYRDGVASPPAGLWATVEGRRLVEEGS